MRNQAFFSSHRLCLFFSVLFFFVALAWTHRDGQACTRGLKDIWSTLLSTIKEYAVLFLFPLLFTLFCLHLHWIYCSCACIWDVCPIDGVYQLNCRVTPQYSVFLHLTGTLCFSSWHHIGSQVFSHLWKYLKWPVESNTLLLWNRMAAWPHG